MGGNGGDAAAGSPSSTGNGGGKRGRDPEDEVYLDNLHSSKRYLSEIMATSLNGLSFGDTIEEGLMESPARSENLLYLRDEIASQYSPMSEDSDECRFYDPTSASSHNPTQVHVDTSCSSPSSPHRYQKVVTGNSTSTSSCSAYPLPCNSLSTVICSPTRRGSHESEGRFPSSPNDMCHVADLRKTALLRSVQMRAQPQATNESHLNQGQEIGESSELEASSEKCQEYEPGYRGQESEDDGI
ncbi:pollen-specific LRR extensin-like protein [Carex rostrata]